MLSKNNFKERIRKMDEKHDRFSIRKFSIGTVSVLIGSLLISMEGVTEVHAADNASSKADDNDNQLSHEVSDKKAATEKIGSVVVNVTPKSNNGGIGKESQKVSTPQFLKMTRLAW